jgi:hypothetical protein
MRNAEVDPGLRMRGLPHDRSLNDRYTRPLTKAHLAAMPSPTVTS